jgi:hypothetical protein
MRFQLLLTLVSLTGCVPIPHLYTDPPEVSGILFEHGTPISGATVMFGINKNTPCERLTRQTTTDIDGRFSFPSESHLSFVLFLLGDNFRNWRFCFRAPSGDLFTWNYHFISLNSGGPDLVISCGVERFPTDDGSMCVIVTKNGRPPCERQ